MAELRATFLEAIAAVPDEDGPRLVFADWLEEQGESNYAEFIRLQCRLAGISLEDSQRRVLESREQQLGFYWSGSVIGWY
jgi:uncharacterized protein (TIGR02996 family)